MKFLLSLMFLVILIGCGSTGKQNTKKKTDIPTVFDFQYYQDLQKNIVRLYELMQGTFVAHAELTSTNLESWTVSDGDSVVLYTVPLGNVNKHGYWLYSYEFMTSLPDKPIYTSIKQIRQLSRDSLEVLYYQDKNERSITLNDVLNISLLNDKISLDSLVLQKKRVHYHKKTAANFIGYSAIYEDKELKCLRQNTYNVSPCAFKVEASFYDRTTKETLNRKNRPNLMIRRDMKSKLLNQIAKKSN